MKAMSHKLEKYEKKMCFPCFLPRVCRVILRKCDIVIFFLSLNKTLNRIMHEEPKIERENYWQNKRIESSDELKIRGISSNWRL